MAIKKTSIGLHGGYFGIPERQATKINYHFPPRNDQRVESSILNKAF